jgi:hypothetical protein
MEKILNDEQFVPSMNMIWDYRESTLAGFSFQDTVKRKEYVNKTQERRGYNYRVALLVDKVVDYGICRMYQIISEDLPATFEVFYDAQEAFDWMRKINHSQP